MIYYTLQYCDAFKCYYPLKHYNSLNYCIDAANFIVHWLSVSAWCISNVYMKEVM